MKIKDTLDLCGWELWNFCIQNHQNLEGLLDLGAGRKVFYTGNDQGKNGREVIYDGSKWKVSAYMSDVEGVESNLSALTERVNAFLDGEVNSNEVLDNLKEIQAFLDAYPEATSLVQILDTKLNKTGGTINGDLRINRGVSQNYISFEVGNGVAQGYLGFNGADNPIYIPSAANAIYTLLHQGNFENIIGNTYLKIDGSAPLVGALTISSTNDRKIVLNNTDAEDKYQFIAFSQKGVEYGFLGTTGDANLKWNGNLVLHSGNVGEYNAGGIVNSEAPTSELSLQDYYSVYGGKGISTFIVSQALGDIPSESTVVNIGHNINRFGRLIYDKKNNLYWQASNGANWLDRKTIAFTDSTVAAANRLVTDAGVNMVLGTGSDVYVGGGTFDNTYIHGKQVVLRYGTGAKFGLRLNSLGGVTIGEKDLAGTDAKLYVDGNSKISGVFDANGGIVVGKNASIGVTDSNDKRLYALQLNNATNTHNLLLGQYTAKEGYNTLIYGNEIKLCYSNAGTSSFTALLVNSSGNVLIGATDDHDGEKVQIKGDLYVEGNIIATKEVSAGGAGTEGEGGAGGFSLYESWGTSAPTEPLALGANLGYELKTRVEDLELAKTKVTFEPALVSGKQIGTIEIDGNKTNLFAPATYAWSEITGTENVLTTAGGVISGGTGAFTIKRDSDAGAVIRFDNTKGLLGYLGVAADGKPIFLNKDGSDRILLHGGNYSEYALPKTGGELKGLNPYHQYILTLDTDNVYYTILSLKSQGVRKGDFRWTSDDTTIVGVSIYNATTKDALGLSDDGLPMYNKNTLLHSGNVGEYALKTDGSNGMNYGANITWGDENANLEDYEGYSSGFRLLHYSTSSVEYSGGIHVGTRYGWQLVRNANTETMCIRYINPDDKSWGNWKTIAFTDSDITGNAAGLHQKNDLGNYYIKPDTYGFSLEGQYATLKIKTTNIYNSQIEFADPNDIVRWALSYRGTNKADKDFCFTKLNEDGTGSHIVTLNYSSGNVLIGATDDNGAKLNVHGGLYVNKYQESGNKSGAYIVINKGDNFFGIGGSASGSYKMSFGTTSDAIGTWKNEMMTFLDNGNVGIGTTDPAYKLSVLGNLFVRDQVYSDTGFILRTNDGEGSRASFSHSSNTLYIQSGYNDGSNVSGYMMLCGINTNHMASLEVRALKSVFDGRLIVGSTNDDGTSLLQVYGTSTFNGASNFYGSTTFGKEGVSMQVNFKCPVVAEDRVTIGGATLRWDDEIKALRLNTSLAATGELSAGGAGTEGGNTGGGGTGTIASPFSRTFTPNEKTSFTFSHDLPYYDVVVQVYEWDSSGMCWNMVLADIEIQNNDVTVTLGRKENVEHKIVVR